MKKIILICILALVLVNALPLIGFAEGIDNALESTSIEIQGNTKMPELENELFHDIFTRLWNFFLENKKEVLTILGGVVNLVFCFVVKGDFKKIKKDTSDTLGLHSSVAEGFNDIVDGYNSLRSEYVRHQTVEDDRNRLISAVLIQNTAILNILSTVYVNNKNLPQGVKDLVTLRYANCQKLLNDDEALCAIFEAAREKLKLEESTDDNEKRKEDSDTEV